MEKFKGYTIKELVDGVLSKRIKVNLRGHNSLTLKENHENSHSFAPEISNTDNFFRNFLINNDSMEKHHHEWIKKERESGKNMDVYEKVTKHDYEPKKPGFLIGNSSVDRYYCYDCDEKLTPILISENEVTFVGYEYYKILNKDYGNSIDTSLISNCKISEMDIKDKIVTEIKIPSGDMIITNFFSKDEIYKTPEYNSINSLLGRIELSKYLESKNIGIGQMGNMSINVWKKEDGSELLFTDFYSYNKETEEETEYLYNGYINLGSISLSVWRWMCADLQILKEYEEEIPKELDSEKHICHDYMDYILAKVIPGEWVIEHYYDIVGDRKDGIYSKLYLKN